MDSSQLIELIEGKLRLQDTPMGVTIIDGFVFAEPTQAEWKGFYQSVRNLNLKPKTPKNKSWMVLRLIVILRSMRI